MDMFEDIELFSGLTSGEKETLSLFCQERNLEAGELLFSEGEDAIAMYVVMSGSLKAYRERSSGTTVLGYVGPGEMVGEMAIFGLEPKVRIASVRAVEATRLLVIVDYAILEISKKHADLYAKIETIITQRKAMNALK